MNVRLEEVEVVQNQKHRQKNIDNHPSQHYNVEQFRIISHSFDLINKKVNDEYHIEKKSVKSVII
ncbi:MAG: hypothetical protein ACE1ZO_03430 [Nitrospirales bacterium]